MEQLGGTDVLGLGENLISVSLISAKRKQRVGQANSVGPTAHFGETKIIATSNREFAGPSW